MSGLLRKILVDLQASEPSVRESALDEVGTLNPKNALGIILPYLSDPDSEVRSTAACNLGEIRNPEALLYLIQAARKDTNEWVRYYALEALAEYHSAEILCYLVDEVYHGSHSRKMRLAVAQQLGEYDSEEAVDALLALLQVDDRYVLTTTVGSLLKLNRQRLRNVWQEVLLTAFHLYLCQTAAKGLAELDEVEPFEIVSPFVTSDDPSIRQGATFALGCLDDLRVIPLLIQQARESEIEDIQETAILALSDYHSSQIGSYLIEALSEQRLSSRAREWIAEQLGTYDCEESVNALILLLEDRNDVVRATALYSLYQLNRPRLRGIWQQALVRQANDSYKRELIEKALAELGDEKVMTYQFAPPLALSPVMS